MTISLAVLPFSNADKATGQAALGEGVADELHHSLTWLKGMQLPPAVDAMTFREGVRDMKAAAGMLSVRYILTGAISRSAGRISILATLHDTSQETKLFEEKQEVDNAEIGTALDRILHLVAGSLDLMPANPPDLTVKKGWTDNADAYISYLSGLSFHRAIGEQNNLKAIVEFETALRADNRFAKAWARLAECHAKHFLAHDSSAHDRVEKAERAAMNAVKLAPKFARPQAVLGLVKATKKEFMEADACFERAITLHPRLFDAWYWRARAAFQQGNLKKAIEYFEKAEEVQPYDYQVPLLLRQAYMSAGRAEDAQAAAIRGINLAKGHLLMNENDARAIYLVAGSMFQIGQYTEALKWAERALKVDPEDPTINYNVACVFAQAGEPDRALDCLEKARTSGMVSAGWMKNDSDLFSLHDNDRFKAMVEDIKQSA